MDGFIFVKLFRGSRQAQGPTTRFGCDPVQDMDPGFLNLEFRNSSTAGSQK